MVIIAAIVIIGTFTLAYIISATNGTMEYPYYFLSSSIDFAPASCIGSFGLSPVIITCVPIIAWVRYEQVREAQKRNTKANKLMVVAAFVSAIGGHGVASFQAHHGMPIHLFFACLFFGGGSVVSTMSLVTDYYCPAFGKPSMRLLRKVLGVFVLLMMATMGFIGNFKITHSPCWDVERGSGCVDSSSYLHWQFVNAWFEIGVFVGLLSFYVTFLPEFKGWKVRIYIERDGNGALIMEDVSGNGDEQIGPWNNQK